MQTSSKRFKSQAFLVVLLMCRAAFGQVGSGDYDADYDVDGDDFANWAGCHWRLVRQCLAPSARTGRQAASGTPEHPQQTNLVFSIRSQTQPRAQSAREAYKNTEGPSTLAGN